MKDPLSGCPEMKLCLNFWSLEAQRKSRGDSCLIKDYFPFLYAFYFMPIAKQDIIIIILALVSGLIQTISWSKKGVL